METINLSVWKFLSLDEYSCSVPTGVSEGKQWRRNNNFAARNPPKLTITINGQKIDDPDDWVMGEYVHEDDRSDYCALIVWKKITWDWRSAMVENIMND